MGTGDAGTHRIWALALSYESQVEEGFLGGVPGTLRWPVEVAPVLQ